MRLHHVRPPQFSRHNSHPYMVSHSLSFVLLRVWRFNLRLMQRGFFRGYDSRVDATLSNSVASAGLSFVAALTPKTLDLIDSRSSVKSGERSLLSAFYSPQEFYEAGAIDRLIVGATGQCKLLDIKTLRWPEILSLMILKYKTEYKKINWENSYIF